MKSLSVIAFFLGIFSFNNSIFAERITILHTNDLHSHFAGQKFDPVAKGGYAALKNLIHEQKIQAHHRKEPTLLLDAGDFSEGSPYFIADSAFYSFKMMDFLGYDAAAMGNHDWLMGTLELEDVLKRTDITTPLVAANMQTKESFVKINQKVKPYIVKKFGHLSVAILGLTTSDIYYSWRYEDGKISDPIKMAQYWVPKLKENYDIVIALTHIGVDEDKKLIEQVSGIDLVVGGHSHDVLQTPVWVENPQGRLVPIVQTGSYTRYLGRIEADISTNKGLELIKYQLIPVNSADRNLQFDQLVHSSMEKIKERMGKEWGNQILAITEIPLNHSKGAPTFWGDFIAKSLALKAGTEIGVHVPSLAGDDLPVGPISEFDLFHSYPRIFELKHNPIPWTIWKVTVPGALLKSLVKIITNTGFAVHFYGMSAKIVKSTDEKNETTSDIGEILVHGEKAGWLQMYTLAMPEGLIRALLKVTRAGYILKEENLDTKFTIVDAIKEQLIKVGRIKKEDAPYYQEKEFLPEGTSYTGENFTMIPGK